METVGLVDEVSSLCLSFYLEFDGVGGCIWGGIMGKEGNRNMITLWGGKINVSTEEKDGRSVGAMDEMG